MVATSPVLLPSQPLQRFEGLVAASPMPSVRRFHSDGILGKEVLAPVLMTGRGDDEAPIHRVELRLLEELSLELLAPGLEQLDVRDAILLHLSSHVEFVLMMDLFGVSRLEFGLFLWRHAIRIVGVHGWHRTHIILIGHGVEEMREEPLLQFSETKGGWE